MRSDTSRLTLGGLAALLALLSLLLALFDWVTALALAGALALGWALVLAYEVGSTLYRRHRTAVLAAGAVVVVALLALLRPDGGERSEASPTVVSGYGAEVWPNRLASSGAFILRERVEGARAAGADGRAGIEPVATGPLMRELRFTPGAASGVAPIALRDGGNATITVNPIDDAELHHARGGSVSRVDLPIGPVVRIELDGIPDEARVAYLTGAGRSLAPLATLVTPLRRMPRWLALTLFAMVGLLAALTWSDELVRPVGRRLTDRPKPQPPARPGQAGAPIERAPLVPRRK